MEQEHEAEVVESGKVNYWRWQPELLEGHIEQRLESPTLTSSLQPPVTGRFVLSYQRWNDDMQEMVFPLTYNVTMFYVSQKLSLLLCFCNVLFLMNWILSHFPGRPHYLGCWYLSSPCCQFWLVLKLGLVSPPVSHKLERCSEPCPGNASICSKSDEAEHCQLMFWLW